LSIPIFRTIFAVMNRMNYPLRIRMFLAMLGLIVLSFLMTGTISYYFFKAENEEYNLERLKRKEYAVRATVDYFIRSQGDELFQNPSRLVEIFDDRICELADIHNQDIGFYDFDGHYIISSAPSGYGGMLFPPDIDEELRRLVQNEGEGVMQKTKVNGHDYIFSATVVTDEKDRPIAILKFPYEVDKRYEQKELRDFFTSLFGIFGLVFFFAVLLALLLSNSIARPLTILTQKISQTRLENNKPVDGHFPPEIQRLADEYNQMLSALHYSAVELAKKERQSAWQDMAKQVAHEIKNPLTPMKLNLQMLAQKIHHDADAEKTKETIEGLIAQVDAMAQIADAFSRYANLPELKREPLLVQDLVRKACGIFRDDKLQIEDFTSGEVYISGDGEQLVRAINYLVKNARQSGTDGKMPDIRVVIEEIAHEVRIGVIDNGMGIPQSEREKIFEPRFTTKTGGMGLGLSIVKTIVTGLDGRITLDSEPGKGSAFYVHLPIIQNNKIP
jgi:two-component system, NtrC family, nitrogen regulation sensor histidine kinase NtrY